MNSNVLPLRRKKWSSLTDPKGRRIPNFLVFSESGIIYYRESFKKLGIPSLFISTNETTIGRARTAAEIAVQRHKNKHLGIDDSKAYGRIKTIAFEKIAKEVLERHTPKKRKGTQENQKYYISKLIEHFGFLDINAITTRDFDDWIEKLKRIETRKTFMDYAKNMNLVMRYAYNERYTTHLVRFKNPDKSEEKAGRVFSDEQIQALYKNMNEETRDQFVLCYECMMRLREALYLTWDRVNLKTGVITLRAKDVKTGSKTGKGREFKMSPNAWERMKNRYKLRNKKSLYVFPSPSDASKPTHQNKTAWRNAKVNAEVYGKARWHDLRHTALSKALLEKRIDPIAVSEYAGVSLRTIQAVYLHSKAEDTKDVAGSVVIIKKA
jgi:integrase